MKNRFLDRSNFSKLLMFIAVFLFVFSISTDKIYAHVLKTHGSIGAVIHVSPEDDPIAGESTDFYFDLKDKKNKLKSDNCDCVGVVLQNGKEIFSAPVFQNGIATGLENASFSFVFPAKAMYKVRVVGKPMDENTFDPFSLEWDIRVDRVSEKVIDNTNNMQESDGTYTALSIVGFIFLIIAANVLINRRYGNKKTK